MRRFAAILLLLVAAVIAAPLIAQESEEAQKSAFLRFIEDRISTPERRISISGLEGALSSDVRIARITVSDSEGPWLTIDNARLNWDQGALLTGRLQINSLTADSITYARHAVPSEGIDAPSPEATGFAIPELPVAMYIEELSVPSVTFGEDVFGLGSEISLDGRLVLAGGSLDTQLAIERLDGPGGTLQLDLAHDAESSDTDIDVILSEPANGVLANLLNIEGRPALDLQITGSGTLRELQTDLALRADGEEVLAGTATLDPAEAGLLINAELHGPVAQLMPEVYGPFFGHETRLTFNAIARDGGGVTINAFTLGGGALTISGNAETASDGFLTALELSAEIVGQEGRLVTLPLPGGVSRIEQARFDLIYGEDDAWSGVLRARNFRGKNFYASNLDFDLSGAAVDLAIPEQRRVTFNADGIMSGIGSADPAIADALGQSIGFGAAGLWAAGEPIQIAEMRIAGKALDFDLSGDIANAVFDGNIALRTPDLAPLSGLLGRQLGGSVDLTADGTLALLSGGFDLTLDGTANDLDLGLAGPANIFAGQTRLGGGLSRDAGGVAARNFRIEGDNARLTADGRFSSTDADFAFAAGLDDLGLVSPNASGGVQLSGNAQGQEGSIDIDATAVLSAGTLAGRQMRDGTLSIASTLEDGELSGSLTGNGFLDGFRVGLASDFALNDAGRQLTDLRFDTAGTELTGSLRQDADGLLSGVLDLTSTDISMPAALLLADASGAADVHIELAPSGDEQTADLEAALEDVRFNDILVKAAEARFAIADLFGVPEIDGQATGSGIDFAGFAVDTARIDATHSGETTGFSLNAALAGTGQLRLAGSLTPQGDGFRLDLDQLRLARGDTVATLQAPATLTLVEGTVRMETVRIDVGGGRLTATGTAGDALAIDITAADLPLGIANAVQPGLGLDGTLDGTVTITGTPDDPDIRFDMQGSGIATSQTRQFGIAGLSGTVQGSYAGDVVRLTGASFTNPSGLALNASGTMPLRGSNGDLSVTGNIPLSIANRTVGARGTQLSGQVSVNAAITGSLARPSFGGSVSVSDAEAVDPATNLRLTGISARASLNGDRLVVDSFSGGLVGGGTISASGTIGLAGNLPADLTFRLNSARYADGSLFVATGSGTLSLTGQLLANPLLSGSLTLERAEISVPDFGGVAPRSIDVKHVNAPIPVTRTLQRTRVGTGSGSGGRSSDLQLDVAISAPNQVFVRGRGLDAELGGTVRLTGSASNIAPTGGFELIRGRLTILGQRIVFTNGTVTLVGDLDPFIDLTASTQVEDTEVFVTVTGPASDLDIEFSSVPELPQDEVLSLLIFKRGLAELSPLQLVRLAAAAAELAGDGSNGLADDLRSATGLDDLDIVTDDQGNAAVRAGRYIQDNVYLNVEAGTEGRTKISLDLDITDSVKARGSATTEGETSIGIFYEEDY